MSLYFKIHPVNPQLRLIRKAADLVREGDVIVYPTDSTYALGCHMEDKGALDRIIRIRRLDERHHFTLLCRDLTEVSIYARFDTPAYRLMKFYTPGPYTFILRAPKDVPRRLLHPRQKTVGLRIPDHAVAHALLDSLGEPMMTTTLRLPEDSYPLNDVEQIQEKVGSRVDLVIDGTEPVLLREGKGEWE